MTKINITIPQPCNENWEAMTSEDKGRFCSSCQKKVFDFTASSDREIVTAFQQNQNLCGRFLNTQLNRDLVKPKEKTTLWLAATTALISLVGLNEVTGQEKAPTEQTDNRILGKFIATPVKEEIEVTGVVKDSSGPLPGANVSVKGTNITTQTDFDGKFSIRTKKNEILVFQFVGMEIKEIKVTNNTPLYLEMKMDNSFMGEIVVGGIKPKKRTFFGRLFHKSKYK